MGSELDRIFTIVGENCVYCSESCWGDENVGFRVGFVYGRNILDLNNGVIDAVVAEGGRKWVCKCPGSPDKFGNIVTDHSRTRDLRDCLMEEGNSNK